MILTGILGMWLGFTLLNLLLWPRLRQERLTLWPRVSILVPARNEAQNIAACIGGLARQDYPNYEVILLDDGSTDGTAEIARRAAAPGRLRILAGAELPAGWLGKSWACHQLAAAASGEYLLFVDADTQHQPTMLRQAVATLRHRRADLLSGLPRQLTGSLGERMLVSLQFLLIAGFLPVYLVPLRNHYSLVAASGAFILIDRERYRAAGGHEAIRASMVDDLSLARQVKAQGGRVLFADIGPVTTVRMYRSGQEAWAGFTKNAYPAMGRSPAVLALAIAAINLLLLAPPLALLSGWLTGTEHLLLLAGAWGASLLATGLTYQRFGLGLWLGLLAPVQAVQFTAIALGSAWRHWSRAGYEWKGRKYA